MELIKLTICTCTVNEDGTVKVNDNDKFRVMINPEKYEYGQKINYNTDSTSGSIASELKYKSTETNNLKFDIILDGTGAVGDSGSEVKEVSDQLKDLKKIVHGYDGKKHEPNHVRTLWGDRVFFGRLEGINTTYTMFKPNGKPLRAKVSLSFKSFLTPQQEALMTNKSSPDLTHVVEFKAGDTLPQICYKIYNDALYYKDVAMANNLTDFRNIKPGTILKFPPVK